MTTSALNPKTPVLPYPGTSQAGWAYDPASQPAGVADDSAASGILVEAADIVAGARNATHGGKERSFTMIAGMWTAYLGRTIRPADVAVMMVMLKIARQSCGEPVRDHFVDMAGYAGIAGELGLEKA